MTGNDDADGDSSHLIPGLWMSEADLDFSMAQDRALIERGLRLQDSYSAAMEAQENVRNLAAEAGRAGEEELPSYLPTEEEKAWDEYHERALSGIALQHRDVFKAFGLDPRRSVLFDDFPELLARACDPQCPVLYNPSEREFSLMETWGPAVLVIHFCPWSGKPLPKALSEEWTEAVNAVLGTEDWSYEDLREKLPDDYWTEAWWSTRGL
jgi:Domain of unknown function (DUF6980)